VFSCARRDLKDRSNDTEEKMFYSLVLLSLGSFRSTSNMGEENVEITGMGKEY
jgi:hypothetical protein